MTRTIEIAGPQIPLAELVSIAASGTEVVLADHGAPLARVVPIEPHPGARVAGLHAGMVIADDDFDEPVPESLWNGDV